MNNIDRLISKITSARLIITVLIITTYCTIVHEALQMVSDKVISKEFFFAIFSGFCAIAGSVTTFYFTRSRKENENTRKKDPDVV